MGSKWSMIYYISIMLISTYCNIVNDETKLFYNMVNGKEDKGVIYVGKQYEEEHYSEYELQEIIKDEIQSLEVSHPGLIPDGTDLNKVIVIDHSLLLDFSPEFLNYGGSDYENELVYHLLSIGFDFTTIEDISIDINGENILLVEGTRINRYTREKWEREQ